ncbi:MAG: hypothetical protein KDA67_08810 [Rhodobacteraceae bacterium]|nr:hypothetical protein [Paracoccaceae bacterium]
MKPEFALDLSHEGIALLQRQPEGTWAGIGKVALDDPDLRRQLRQLRDKALGIAGKGFTTRLIIPNSQILYRDIPAAGPDDDGRRAQIATALEGVTPYDVEDLVFDWQGDSDVVKVAVVARETLNEAESFAIEHRFNPVSFGAESDSGWMPYLGRTAHSYTLFDADMDLRETQTEPMENSPGPEIRNIFVDSFAKPADPPEDAAKQAPKVPPGDMPAAANDQARDSAEPQDGTADPSGAKPDVKPVTAPLTFSSRRSGSAPTGLADTDERPISRMTSRIVIGAAAANPTGEPADGLRADRPSPPPPPPPPLPLVGEKRVLPGKASETRKPPSAQNQAVLRNLLPRLKAGVASARQAKPAAVSESSLGPRRKLIRKQAKPTPENPTAANQPLPTHVPPAPPPLNANGDDYPINPVFHEAAKSAMPLPGPKAIFAALAVLAFLVLLWLLYAFLWNDGSGVSSVAPETLETTAAERGVRSDNRARPRPTDLANLHPASSGGPEADTIEAPLPAIRPVRPERRSLFEGMADPEAGLADTATPLTEPTDQELADIRAAGLSAAELTRPTDEELAEGAPGETAESDGETGPSETELAVLYADSGILQGIVAPPEPVSNEDRDDIYVASLDRPLEANDAIILPDFNRGVQDDPPARKTSPPGPLVTFDLDERGLVKATEKGALTPDGVLVMLGRPGMTPPTRPETERLLPPDPLLGKRPKGRPEDLKTGEAAVYVQGQMTLSELASRQPNPRPQSGNSSPDGVEQPVSKLAILSSRKPGQRPGDFSQTVEKFRATAVSAAVAEAVSSDDGEPEDNSAAPAMPTRASVAKTATIKNAINLSQLNLIGVYGTPAERTALLRLPSGRFVKVKPGDRVDGGKIAAIGDSSLSYVKSGRNRVLKVPN